MRNLDLRSCFHAAFTVAALTGAACGGGSTGPLPEGGVRVLFLGNSLTYTNDLPRTIADMAKSVDATPLVYRVIAKPNYALEDHFNDGLEGAINGKGWQFIVMQQGPSSLAASGAHLTAWTTAINTLAVAAGARSALYQVWPAGGDPATFAAVRNNYRAAAVAVNGMFIPAGQAWLEVWEEDPQVGLYSADFFHPSPLGTYVAALVHFEMLYDRPATELPDIARVNGRRLNVPAATVAMLQEQAHATVVAWGLR